MHRAVPWAGATAASAVVLAMMSASPAVAAGGWTPSAYALTNLPTTAVDGEISVTEVAAGAPAEAAGTLRSFQADGTPVTYAKAPTGAAMQWGPNGDALLVVDPATSGTVTAPSADAKPFTEVFTDKPGFWSSEGDSVTSDRTGAPTTTQTSVWANKPGVHTDTWPTTETANGAAMPVPGYTFGVSAAWTLKADNNALVTVGTAGTRDIAVAPTTLPRWANADATKTAASVLMGYSALDAHAAVAAGSGKLAFVGTPSGGTPGLYVVESDAMAATPTPFADLGADCAGAQPTFAPSTHAIAYLAFAPDCSSATLHTLAEGTDGTFVNGVDATVTTSTAGSTFEWPTWRASTPVTHPDRIAGTDRITTAIKISQAGYPSTKAGAQLADGVVLASAANFPDAVVAGPLSAMTSYPLLLTGPKSLDSRTLAEMKRLMPNRAAGFVYVIGGTGAISQNVINQLGAAGFPGTVVAGKDRFQTSVAVAEEIDAWGFGVPRHSVFLADGRLFPDALSAGPAAAQYFAPVLLTNGATVPSPVKAYVNGQASITDVFSVGDAAASASTAFGSRASGRTVTGTDRYATSAHVVDRFFPSTYEVGFASGANFPDALAAGAYLGTLPYVTPLQLVRPTGLTYQPTGRSALSWVTVFGGTAAVSNTVLSALQVAGGTQSALFGADVTKAPNPLWVGTPAAGMSPQGVRPGTSTQAKKPAGVRPTTTGRAFGSPATP